MDSVPSFILNTSPMPGKAKIPSPKDISICPLTLVHFSKWEVLKFNTAVSTMMEFVNAWQVSKEGLDKKDFADFLKILSPFVPHLAEELWSTLGLKDMCCQQKWPKYDEKLIVEKNVLLIVQVNGKVRDKIEAKAGIKQEDAEKLVLASGKIKALVGKSEVKKFVFVPDKLINIVI